MGIFQEYFLDENIDEEIIFIFFVKKWYMIYVVFIVFAVIVIFIININNTKSKEDANKQYFSESIKSYENFNPTYIKYGLDSEYILQLMSMLRCYYIIG